MTDLVFVIIFVGYDAAWHQLVRLYWDKVSLQIGNLSLGEQLLIMVIIVIKLWDDVWGINAKKDINKVNGLCQKNRKGGEGGET